MPIAAEQTLVTAILSQAANPVLIELGGHHGTDTLWLHAACKQSPRMVVLEPDPRNAWVVEEKAAMLPGVTVMRTAIAAWDGTCSFYLCDNKIGKTRASSSIRKPKKHLKYFPWCTFAEPTSVPCITLDSLLKRFNFGHVDLIWADVQGAERDMIAGGAEALQRTRYLFTEFDDEEFYEGQADRKTLLEMLPDWKIAATFDWNVLLQNEKYRG